VPGGLDHPAGLREIPGNLGAAKEGKFLRTSPKARLDFLPPFAYAELQILGDAIEATQSLDDDELAQYIHSHTFKTIVGDIAFGKDGEWTEGRSGCSIKGNDLEQFKKPATVTILAPPQYKTGELIYPYTEARK
jgi:branched-chain amino acid transport system substrate-binding protein